MAMPASRLGVQVLNPRVYLAGAYLWTSNNYGYPRMNGAGVGIEKLPDLDEPFSFFASYYYYPTLTGNFTDPTTQVGYKVTVAFPAISGRRGLQHPVQSVQDQRPLR